MAVNVSSVDNTTRARVGARADGSDDVASDTDGGTETGTGPDTGTDAEAATPRRSSPSFVR